MGIWEIAFRSKYNYPFMKLSEKYPGTRISMWCVWNREMIHIPMNHENVMEEVEKYTTQIGRSIESYKPSMEGYIITLVCSCDLNPNVWDITSRNNLVDLYPAVFLDGWGYYRVISFNEDDLRKFFLDLSGMSEYELISKKMLHFDAVPSTILTESFFSGLTDRQMEALTKAYDYGYYTSPRGVTTDSVASSLGISRSTYEEHLRKAENRIMEALIPYLKLFRAGQRKKGEMISPRLEL